MNIYDILSQIEEELGETKSGLFHKKLDTSKLSELFDQLKNNLPKAIEEASYIVNKKEKMLETAKDDAQALIEDANRKAKTMVEDSSVTKKAEDDAKKLIETTIKRCEQLLDTTKNNVDKILKAVEDYLAEHLSIVHDSREELSNTLIQLKNNLKKD